jgi:hypothetical protein
LFCLYHDTFRRGAAGDWRNESIRRAPTLFCANHSVFHKGEQFYYGKSRLCASSRKETRAIASNFYVQTAFLTLKRQWLQFKQASAGTKVPPQYMEAPAGLRFASPKGFHVLSRGFIPVRSRENSQKPDLDAIALAREQAAGGWGKAARRFGIRSISRQDTLSAPPMRFNCAAYGL